MLIRDGVIVVRPGMAKLVATTPATSDVIGAIYYKDNVQTEHVIVSTATDLYHFDGSTWTAITGTTLTGTAFNQVHFAVFPFSGTTKVIAVNDKDVPQVYTGSGNFAALGGSPPVAKDVTVAFQRVILANVVVSGTRRASSLWVSGFQDPTTWPAANQVDLPDTGDIIVTVKALNNQSFAIYKEFSQWVGIGAANIFPFVFSLSDQQPGPMSPAAVVQVEVTHYYLGIDGNVYRFDGTRCIQIGSRVRKLLQSDIDPTNYPKVHGYYDPTDREIWWFWPSISNYPGWAGMVYRLAYEDIPDAYSPKQVFTGVNPTYSLAWRNTAGLAWIPGLNGFASWTSPSFAMTYPTWNSMTSKSSWGSLIGASTGDVYLFGQVGGDNGAGIDAYWDTPLRPVAGVGENIRLDAIESNFKQMPSTTNVDIIAVTSDTLGDAGTQQAPQTIDISSTSKLRALYYNLFARYVGIRHRITNATSLIEYRGSVLFSYKREEG